MRNSLTNRHRDIPILFRRNLNRQIGDKQAKGEKQGLGLGMDKLKGTWGVPQILGIVASVRLWMCPPGGAFPAPLQPSQPGLTLAGSQSQLPSREIVNQDNSNNSAMILPLTLNSSVPWVCCSQCLGILGQSNEKREGRAGCAQERMDLGHFGGKQLPDVCTTQAGNAPRWLMHKALCGKGKPKSSGAGSRGITGICSWICTLGFSLELRELGEPVANSWNWRSRLPCV